MKHPIIDQSLHKIASVIKNGLPHAFDYRYWEMADTTYKEEIALSVIEQFKMKPEVAKSFLRKCGLFKNEFPILYYWLDGQIQEGMGVYTGVTEIGKKFMNNYYDYKPRKRRK